MQLSHIIALFYISLLNCAQNVEFVFRITQQLLAREK